ncbi:MAG: hypothetical protein K2V38_13450, partial [Gemmataceae bacterium]|nr:hypothetical protein [Gemmataceae bacterium]
RAVCGLGVLLTLLGAGLLAGCGVGWALGSPPAGWAVVLAAVVLVGGLQIGCVGVVGLYVLKIFTEAKRRPSYIVDGGRVQPRPLPPAPSPKGRGGEKQKHPLPSQGRGLGG